MYLLTFTLLTFMAKKRIVMYFPMQVLKDSAPGRRHEKCLSSGNNRVMQVLPTRLLPHAYRRWQGYKNLQSKYTINSRRSVFHVFHYKQQQELFFIFFVCVSFLLSHHMIQQDSNLIQIC